jgi:phosphonoacetate hydrolase
VFTPSEDPVQGAVPGTFSTRLVDLHHAREPELVYVLRSGTGNDAHGLPGLGLITGGVPVGGGMHGGLNRHELNTMLVLGGAAANGAARSDAPVGIIDIGPTILDLMGLAAPASMQGHSLLDAANLMSDTKAFTASSNGFHQHLSVARRGDATFFLHGERPR